MGQFNGRQRNLEKDRGGLCPKMGILMRLFYLDISRLSIHSWRNENINKAYYYYVTYEELVSRLMDGRGRPGIPRTRWKFTCSRTPVGAYLLKGNANKDCRIADTHSACTQQRMPLTRQIYSSVVGYLWIVNERMREMKYPPIIMEIINKPFYYHFCSLVFLPLFYTADC